MNETGFILLSIGSTIAYISILLFFLFVIVISFYVIRNNLIYKLLQNLETKQIEQFRIMAEKQLSHIDEEIKINTSNIKETQYVIKALSNNLSDIERVLQNSNETDRTERGEIISKIEQSIVSNKAFNRQISEMFEKTMAGLQETSFTNSQPPPHKINSPKTSLAKLNEEDNTWNDQPDETIYYLPFPDAKGFFWDDNKYSEIKNNSAFIMNLMKNNPKRAQFSLITNNEKIIKNALLNPKAFLKPICNISGNLSGHTISVVEKGELELQNNKWVVSEGKKVKIRISY